MGKLLTKSSEKIAWRRLFERAFWVRASLGFFVVGGLASGSLPAQPAIGAPKKTQAKSVFIDPSFTALGGQLSFDEETKKALERGKRPGLLLAEKEEPGRVFSIEIIGAKKTEPDAVVLRLTSKIARPFNPVTVADDISEILRMGPFSDVVVRKKLLPLGGIALRYELTEIPTIFQIKIVGQDALSEDEIKEAIAGLENYHVARPARLLDFAEKIREFYVSKGYYLAKVDYSTKDTSEEDIKKREAEGLSEKPGSAASEIETTRVLAPDFVDVVFTIKENRKVRINRISFSGNFHLDDDLLRRSLRSQEEHLLSVITDWGTFRKDFLEIDTLIIEKTLHDNGFLQAKVLTPDVELSADKSFININFRIIENDQYHLGTVSVSGDLVERNEVIYRSKKDMAPSDPIFLASKLRAAVEQKEGEIFNKSKMAEDVLAIAEKYRDVGYAYANVSPIPQFDEENKIVNINIEIESGPLVSIERIDIEGNEKTKDEVIRRELVLFEGDLYSSSLIRMSEQNVQRLGYFETVEVTNKSGSSPDKMIITIKVKEQSTGNIQAGAGYGTGGEGLVLRGQISNQNLFGRGQTLSATVNWSNYRRMFDVAFVEPYLTYVADQPLSLAFTAYNRDIYLGEFNRLATGGDITLGYPLGGPFAELSRKWKRKVSSSLAPYVLDFEALSLLLTYTVERVQISGLSMPVRNWDLHEDEPRYTSSLRPAIRLDQRDNRLFPTRGLFFEFRSEFASEYLVGKSLAQFENYLRKRTKSRGISDGRRQMVPEASANNFLRFGTNFRFYHNLDDWFFLKGFVFKTNFELGLLNTLGKPLVFENYALGGSNTLRGYSYRSISPTERAAPLFPFDSRRDMRVGGNKQFYGSFELEFPIFKVLKISGVLFFDFGNVYSPEDNLFYVGGASKEAGRVHPSDPLGLYRVFGLYSSTGFGVRWLSPLGYLRFEWGFPLNPRPATTPGLSEKDPPVAFEFNIGPSF